MDHRKIKEELAQKDFQDAVALFNQEQKSLEKMNQSTHDAQMRIASLTQLGGAQGPALSQIHEFLRGQKILIERQAAKIQDVEKLVEAKREILRQAALEYKIMEKMRENKLQDHKSEQWIQEQKEMDEQSILRFKAVKES